ncbi:hypothetical protein SK128_001279, partial [Halocaridina rubra]
YFSLKGRRHDLFGDLSDDLVMLELLSALEPKTGQNIASPVLSDYGRNIRKASARGNPFLRNKNAESGSWTSQPVMNILPTEDHLEKISSVESDSLLDVHSPQTSSATSLRVPVTEAVVDEDLGMTPSVMSVTSPETLPPTSDAYQAQSFSTLSSGTSTKFIPSSFWEFERASSIPENPPKVNSFQAYSTAVTESLQDSENHQDNKTGSKEEAVVEEEDEEDIVIEEVNEEEDYLENVKKVISRKDIFKLFKRNLDKKRIEAISTMMQNTFINDKEYNFTLPDHFQPYDVHSAVIDHFVPLLDEIQPSQQVELIAQQHSLLFNHFTMDQLQELMPVIDWHYLLAELYGKNITGEDNIYIFHPGYMIDLNFLLTTLDPWIVHYGMVVLYAYDVLKEASIAPPNMDREDFCLQASKNVFGDAMSHMYLHYVGNKTIVDIRRHTSSIVEMLKEEVKLSISRTSWLPNNDRQEALNKIHTLRAEVGAYDKHWNISYVNESHEGITIDSNKSFLMNVLEIYRSFRRELYRIYHEPVDKDMLIWSFTVQPFIVNAFHMQTTNSIVFPEAFFQKPYYNPKAPEYVNYGSTGASMAHEIFHGLDFTGMQFDHLGAKSHPFSNETLQQLHKVIACYHELLSDVFYEEVPVEEALIAMEIDSSATLNENLADIGGITHAFRAYQRWESQNYREPRLPAVGLNPYQLFFVSAVRPYCAVIPNLAKIFLMEIDEHLPNGMRMNAMLMNTPEFAQVFNCNPESRMVSKHTCPIF